VLCCVVFEQVFPGIPCTRGVPLVARRRAGERSESNSLFLSLIKLLINLIFNYQIQLVFCFSNFVLHYLNGQFKSNGQFKLMSFGIVTLIG